MKNFQTVCFFAVCVFSVLALEAQGIDFESPEYVAGSGLPSPWVIDSSAVVGITAAGPIAGAQSLYAGYTPGSFSCLYPMVAPDNDTLSLSFTIRLAAYSAGSYQPGYGAMGGIALSDWYLGGVYFDLEKPYSVPASASHRQIWFKNAYNVVGYFVDGGTYTITYAINWATKTSVVRIVGDGGVDLTLNNQDNSINKNNFTGFKLWGTQFSNISTQTLFDTILIGEPPQPIVGDFNASGAVDFYDFALLAQRWFSVSGGTSWNADYDLDNSGISEGVIDIADLAIFCENWLAGV